MKRFDIIQDGFPTVLSSGNSYWELFSGSCLWESCDLVLYFRDNLYSNIYPYCSSVNNFDEIRCSISDIPSLQFLIDFFDLEEYKGRYVNSDHSVTFYVNS